MTMNVEDTMDYLKMFGEHKADDGYLTSLTYVLVEGLEVMRELFDDDDRYSLWQDRVLKLYVESEEMPSQHHLDDLHHAISFRRKVQNGMSERISNLKKEVAVLRAELKERSPSDWVTTTVKEGAE